MPSEKRLRKREGRQARLEAARAAAVQARRRRRVIQVLVLVAVVAGAIAVSVIAGGDGEGEDDTEVATAETATCESDDATKPEVEVPEGEAPTELQTTDIEDGEGQAAAAGDTVTVQYVGVLFDTKEQFDASWDSGEPFTFTLGRGDVIKGWDEGVVGMQPCGRRQLVIPPDLAYGPTGQGSIPPDATLVFVVDLVSIEPA